MRLSTLFVASLALAAFGCGDDSGGEDDGNSTNPTTTAGTGDSTGADGGPGGDPTTNATTGDPTTGDPTTGDPTEGMDSSGSGGSDSGGAATECETFCADYFGVCGPSADNNYGTEMDCVSTCDGYDMAEFMCQRNHLDMAIEDNDAGSIHCLHSNAGQNCPGQ